MGSSIDGIAVSFHPLHELQIIQRPPLHEFADLNVLKTQKKTKPHKQLSNRMNSREETRVRNKEIEYLWSDLGDFELVEDILKDLVVLDHLVLALGVEVDLVHRHHPRMSRVHQLAVHRARTCLPISRHGKKEWNHKEGRRNFFIAIEVWWWSVE